ncbi:MAG: hypothetical protein RIC16_04035 [Rhodospirillales bacterium]
MRKVVTALVGYAMLMGVAAMAPVAAHDFGSSDGTNQGQMPMMGQGQMPMMGQGHMPMMGQGQMPMMGQGHMPMMGQGQMPMMGQGQMPMMGQGHMPMMEHGAGTGMYAPLRRDLSAEEVEHMIGHRLEWQGNPNLKMGPVVERDEDTIVADIVTQDGSLVQRLEVDRHTGRMQAANN